MPDKKEFRHKCELFVLQSSPDPLKGEKVNVGLVLRDTSGPEPLIMVRISERLRRLNCLEPGFELERFEEALHQVESVMANAVDFDSRIDQFDDWPEELTLSPAKAVLTDSMADEMKLLAEQYLKPRKWMQPPDEQESRETIFRSMQSSFEAAGVWALMDKRLPVAEFTRPGDSLKLDCGYLDQSHSSYRIFHAVPLLKDSSTAKVLAYSWPMIRDGIARKRELSCDMVALVANDLDRIDEAVSFGWETMEKVGLRVEPLSTAGIFAEQARVALHA